MHKHIHARAGIPPCLTGRGNGFSSFGEPQTRGTAGPFQIAALLKSPSVYEYGDGDLGEREWRKEGERDRGRERSESERERVSEVLFPACPVALGWIYALDLEECVCLRVCGANERVRVETEPEATGQRVITHRHAYSRGNRKPHKHSHTLIRSLLIYFFLPSTQSPPHRQTHPQSHTQSTYACMHQLSAPCPTSPPRSPLILLLISPFLQCRASIRSTLDKPMRFRLPSRVHLYAALWQNKQPSVYSKDSISVSPSSSDYTAHELWIGGRARWRSDSDDKGRSLGPC